MKLIIDIDEQHFELLQMAVMNGMGDKAQKIIAQGTPIPDNATNGDVVQMIFPDKDNFNDGYGCYFYKTWWNAPYKKGGKE